MGDAVRFDDLESGNSDNTSESFKVVSTQPKLGETYPILGLITKIEQSEKGEILARINDNIIAHINLTKTDQVELLKQKAFESGVFIVKVVAVEPEIEVECKAAIFGKSQAFHA